MAGSIPQSTDLRRQINLHKRSLEHLEEQAGTFGFHTPPHITMEIPNIETQLRALSAQIAELEQQRPAAQGLLDFQVTAVVSAPSLTDKARAYLQRLCVDIPSRRTGSVGNREATDLFAAVARSYGFATASPVFECTDWTQAGVDQQMPVIVKDYMRNIPNFGVVGPWDATPGNTIPAQWWMDK